jgi:hypothetical protein
MPAETARATSVHICGTPARCRSDDGHRYRENLSQRVSESVDITRKWESNGAIEEEDNESEKGGSRKRLSNKERKDDALVTGSPEYIIRTQLILPDLQLGAAHSDNMVHKNEETEGDQVRIKPEGRRKARRRTTFSLPA